MEKEKNAHVLQGDKKIGEVQIADDVVAMIATLAAMEVEGVASLAGGAGEDFLSKVGRKPGKGTRVEVKERVVSVDIALNLKYGFSIPAISQKVQEKIKSAIETMTGLEVADVNIRIAGVSIEA